MPRPPRSRCRRLARRDRNHNSFVDSLDDFVDVRHGRNGRSGNRRRRRRIAEARHTLEVRRLSADGGLGRHGGDVESDGCEL